MNDVWAKGRPCLANKKNQKIGYQQQAAQGPYSASLILVHIDCCLMHQKIGDLSRISWAGCLWAAAKSFFVVFLSLAATIQLMPRCQNASKPLLPVFISWKRKASCPSPSPTNNQILLFQVNIKSGVVFNQFPGSCSLKFSLTLSSFILRSTSPTGLILFFSEKGKFILSVRTKKGLWKI